MSKRLYNLTLILYAFFLFGLFLIPNYKFVSNGSLILLFFVGLYSFFKNYSFINRHKCLPWLFFLLPLLLHLCHVFYVCTEENWSYYFETLLLKTAFFIIPFSFMVFDPIKQKHFFKVLSCFFILSVCYTTGVLIHYLFALDQINQSYLHAKVIPAPINHIRLSLMVVTAIFIACYLLVEKFSWGIKHEKIVTIFSVLFLVFFLHVYAVRSGLFSFYLLLIIFGTLHFFRKKKVVTAFLLLVVIISIPIASYYALPTFKARVQNTVDDLCSLELEQSVNQYSLAGRLTSYKVSYSLWKEAPLFGIGVGNLKHEIIDRYHRDYPHVHDDMIKLPHNQFLRYATSFGIVGLFFFLIGFYYPLFYQKNYKNLFLLMQYVLVTLSFLVEGTLDTMHGLYFTLGFIMLPLLYLKKEAVNPQKKGDN